MGELSFRALSNDIRPEDYLALLSTEGISIHFGQWAEDVVLLNLFNDFKNGFYVDIGAFHPRKYSNTFLLNLCLGWRGLNIDASSKAINLFKKERPKDINVHVGIGFKPGKATYYKFKHSARNTFSASNVKRQLKKDGSKITGQELIDVRPLADVLNDHLPKEQKIDLLNIDIEGYDIAALATNDWSKYRPSVVMVEDYSNPLENNELSQIHKLLLLKNYHLYSRLVNTSIYLSNDFKIADSNCSTVIPSSDILLKLANTRKRALLLSGSLALNDESLVKESKKQTS